MVYLEHNASHEDIDAAINNAKAFARGHGCKDLWWEPICETLGYDSSTYRMHLIANIDGVDTTLLVGPLFTRQHRKLT